MPLTIGRPEDVSVCYALLFGPPGAGKTHHLGSLADDERTAPALILDFEGGSQTLVGRDIDVARIHTPQDFEEALDVLRSGEYRSFGVDSLSEAQVGGLLAILEKDKRRADPDQLAQQDWGVILVQMRRFVRRFKDLGIHGFMTALAKDALDPRVGKIVVPAFQGAFSGEVEGVFDVVTYLAQSETEEGQTERLLLLRDYPNYRIKARSPYGHQVPSELVGIDGEVPTAGALLDALGYKTPAKGRKESK